MQKIQDHHNKYIPENIFMFSCFHLLRNLDRNGATSTTTLPLRFAFIRWRSNPKKFEKNDVRCSVGACRTDKIFIQIFKTFGSIFTEYNFTLMHIYYSFNSACHFPTVMASTYFLFSTFVSSLKTEHTIICHIVTG